MEKHDNTNPLIFDVWETPEKMVQQWQDLDNFIQGLQKEGISFDDILTIVQKLRVPKSKLQAFDDSIELYVLSVFEYHFPHKSSMYLRNYVRSTRYPEVVPKLDELPCIQKNPSEHDYFLQVTHLSAQYSAYLEFIQKNPSEPIAYELRLILPRMIQILQTWANK